ncbi:MAG: hypothetical protein GY816_17505 [Cytophagales bacterium]|nr:hypothetical protein [Cytophagales bacterium]
MAFFIDNPILDTLYVENTGIFEQLLYQAMPSFSELTIENKGLAYPISGASPFKWGVGDGQGGNQITLTYKDQQLNDRYLSSDIDKISYGTLVDSSGLYAFMLLVFCIFLFVLYRIIFFAISKIYSWDVRFEKLNDKFVKGWIKSVLKSKMNLMLLGLPNSGKTRSLDQEFQKGKSMLRGDCILIHHKDQWQEFVDKTPSPQHKTIILDNFEYRTESHETNKKKLHLLETLVSAGKRVIISTEIRLSAISEFYAKAIESTDDKDLIEEYGQNIKVWRNITSGFIDVHKPLEDNSKSEDLSELDSELRYGEYLANTGKLIRKSLSGEETDPENIVLAV